MNLRVIKKDIEFLISDFIDDCYLFMMVHPDDKKAVKAHYKAIGEDLVKGLDGLCDRLSALAKK